MVVRAMYEAKPTFKNHLGELKSHLVMEMS